MIINRNVHAQKGYSSRSVCLLVFLLTVDLEGCCITTIKTSINLKKMIYN